MGEVARYLLGRGADLHYTTGTHRVTHKPISLLDMARSGEMLRLLHHAGCRHSHLAEPGWIFREIVEGGRWSILETLLDLGLYSREDLTALERDLLMKGFTSSFSEMDHAKMNIMLRLVDVNEPMVVEDGESWEFEGTPTILTLVKLVLPSLEEFYESDEELTGTGEDGGSLFRERMVATLKVIVAHGGTDPCDVYNETSPVWDVSGDFSAQIREVADVLSLIEREHQKRLQGARILRNFFGTLIPKANLGEWILFDYEINYRALSDGKGIDVDTLEPFHVSG